MLNLDDVQNGAVEIVGFNGTPHVDCGRALPVVRRKSDGRYCVLSSIDHRAQSWFHEDEVATMAMGQRWTQFREALALPSSCAAGEDGWVARQPMVVYATRSVLDTAGRVTWPGEFNGELLFWRRLAERDDTVQGACLAAESAEALLDDWASHLEKRYDALYRQSPDQSSLRRVADYMLCAAKSRPRRWQAYLRYAMAQEPGRVQQTFDAFTRKEFPNVPWDSYLEQIKALSEVLRSVAVAAPQRSSSSPSETVRHKLHGIAARLPLEKEPRKAA
jgi:hypothetical protein